MPLSLIQSVLGLSFLLIWVFIGTMILRDRQLSIRSERNAEDDERLAAQRSLTSPPTGKRVVRPGKRTRLRRDASAA